MGVEIASASEPRSASRLDDALNWLYRKNAEVAAQAATAAEHLPSSPLPVSIKQADTGTAPKTQPKDKVGTGRTLTHAESALIVAGEKIATTIPEGQDMAFTHAVLCQVGLPRARVEGREFMRQSGSAWMNVQAGILDEGKGPVVQPVPYGPMPRLALAWISTYALRTGEQEIRIGDSAAEFLRLMGMGDDGKRYATLRKQMHALAACRLQLGFKGRTFNGQPVEQFDAWQNNTDTTQRSLWPGVMRLSESYFGSLIESAVPLDNRALMALKGSALSLDVYAWLAHRLHRIEGKGFILHWHSLREQFAQEYTGKDADKDFKKKFLPTLRKVLTVYPQANVKQVRGGVLLNSSPPPIPLRGGPTK